MHDDTHSPAGVPPAATPKAGETPAVQPQFPEIMTIQHCAEYLQLHPQVVYRHVRAGTLPASRIGRTVRFKKSVLDAFLEREAWSSIGRFMKFVEFETQRQQPARETPPPAPAAPIRQREVKRFSEEVD
jgi:excisionase family DNA binding protein